MMSMTKTIALAAAITAGTAMTAGAAVLDFMTYANATEKGVDNGTVINFDGLDVSFNSSHYAYFDGGNAGLGVCKVLTSTKQCSPSSDDNVTDGESVTIGFDVAQTLSDLKFRAEGHVPLADARTLLFGINGGSLMEYTFAALSTLSFQNVLSATFAFGGSNSDQFYVQSATATPAPVPLPGAAPLALAGLGAFGVMRRRQSRKTV